MKRAIMAVLISGALLLLGGIGALATDATGGGSGSYAVLVPVSVDGEVRGDWSSWVIAGASPNGGSEWQTRLIAGGKGGVTGEF